MNAETAKPLIAVTLGDPAGVGPETVAAAWSDPAVHELYRPVALGHPEILRRAAALWETGAQVVEIASPAEARPSPTCIPCIRCGADDVLAVPPGTLDARAGEAAYQAVVAATRLALAGDVAAVTTAPLHKKALHLAGHDYPGHTELLAEMCGIRDFAMMLYLGPEPAMLSPAGLAVVHVTLHTSMRKSLEELSEEGVLAKARLADRFMTRLSGQRPRIGVCALNPHGGESGLFGDEETRIILPAIECGRREGLELSGPLPADTLLVRAKDGEFEAVVAIYHDQGHIALKLLGMHRAVNVTLGLPIIRTSVAHGTAFDIAWKRKAKSSSMVEALRVASRLAATQ